VAKYLDEAAAQSRIAAAMKRGFHTPEWEIALARMLDELTDG